MTETPEPVGAGLSARRDRMWGLVGGPLGVAVGVGSAVIAVYVEGADPSSSSSAPYPPFFAKRQLLVYDLFLAPGDRRRGRVRGGIVLTRRSPYPRTDALGPCL